MHLSLVIFFTVISRELIVEGSSPLEEGDLAGLSQEGDQRHHQSSTVTPEDVTNQGFPLLLDDVTNEPLVL